MSFAAPRLGSYASLQSTAGKPIPGRRVRTLDRPQVFRGRRRLPAADDEQVSTGRKGKPLIPTAAEAQ